MLRIRPFENRNKTIILCSKITIIKKSGVDYLNYAKFLNKQILDAGFKSDVKEDFPNPTEISKFEFEMVKKIMTVFVDFDNELQMWKIETENDFLRHYSKFGSGYQYIFSLVIYLCRTKPQFLILPLPLMRVHAAARAKLLALIARVFVRTQFILIIDDGNYSFIYPNMMAPTELGSPFVTNIWESDFIRD